MYPSIEVVTPPASEPVTVDEVKTHLRLLPDDDEDDMISMFISAARSTFEFMTNGRIVLPTTFHQNYHRWPVTRWHWPIGHVATLPIGLGNVTEVTEITYVDPDGTTQTLDGWELDRSGTPAVVYLPGNAWPALSVDHPRPISVEFVAGWPDVDSVPSAVKLGILTLVGDWYSYREAHGSVDLKATPYGFDRLCQLYHTGLGVF